MRTTSKGRRAFLKTGLAGLAGAAVTSRSSGTSGDPAAADRKIIERVLGKTGIRLPIVSIGAASYDAGLYRKALDSGITHIDTSQYYYNGRHERLVGEVIKGRPRESVVIATSMLLGERESTRDSFLKMADAGKMVERFDLSLERMGLDHADIFYIAGVANRDTAFNDVLLKGLETLKKTGKARFVGLAVHQNQAKVLQAAVETGVHEVAMVAYNFRQRNAAEIKQAIAQAAGAGLGIVVMKPMAGAFWDRERTKPINGRAALKWALQDENVHSSVPGISTLDQLEADLSIMEHLELTPEERADLKLEEAGEPGLYCQGCGTCLEQCPEQVEVPTLMRGYMYAYGYRDFGRARSALEQAAGAQVPCGDCAACQVTCAQGFDVRGRIQDVTRLMELPAGLLD